MAIEEKTGAATWIERNFLEIFQKLDKLSLERFLKKRYLKRDGESLEEEFIERYVISLLLLAIIAYSSSCIYSQFHQQINSVSSLYIHHPMLTVILSLIILVRCFFIWVKQINVLIFDRMIKQDPGIKSIPRLVILLGVNYMELIFWFATLYCLWPDRYLGSCFNSFWEGIYFSVVTMTTLGYGDITPVPGCGMFLVIIQTLLGLFMTLMVLGRFISLLPGVDGQSGRYYQTRIGEGRWRADE